MTQQRPWRPSELRLFAQFEETPRCAIANTRLPHGHTNDLCQQRLGELAHLGMLFDSGGEWTTEASDNDLIARVLQLRQAAEILQDVKGDFQTLAELSLGRELGKRSPNARKTAANVAQQLAFLCRSDAGLQRMEKLIEQQVISLGKKLSGFRRERVERLRLARGLRLPDCWTSPSRSRLERCERTALSVRLNASASSLTVASPLRSSPTTCPRVLERKRLLQRSIIS